MPERNLERDSAPAAVVRLAGRLGRNLRVARQRRAMTQEEVAGRAGISRATLVRIEQGALGTGLGAYLSVLWVLGLHEQMAPVAAPERDDEGRTLEAARRGERVRPGKVLSDEF